MPAELPEHYAESVMISLLSDDGVEDLSIRLARFPHQGKAHVWLHAANANGAWSVVDESFVLDSTGATRIASPIATFSAAAAQQSIRFTSTERGGRLQGQVVGNILVHASRHVTAGTGVIPVEIDVGFEARSRGYRSATNRWEMTGRLYGTVTINDSVWTFDHDGKWHEQVGPRRSFAPAFTYLNVFNQDVALLAIGFADGARGYVERQSEVTLVTSLEIEPQGQAERDFVVTLADGSTVSGTAIVQQRWSVPIEGVMRPGTSVIAETDTGRLLGSLNDWNPAR